MEDVKWIKVVTNVFDNLKIRQIESMPEGDTILVIWFKLLCMAGKTNGGGLIYLTPEIPYTDEMLAVQLNRPLATVKLALRTFEAFRMIEIVDDFLRLSSWSTYQNVDRMDAIREQNRKRKQDQRAREKRLSTADVTDMSRDSHVTVTEKSRDVTPLDIDIDKEIDKDISSSSSVSSSFDDDDDDDDVCLLEVYENLYGKATMQIKKGLAEYSKALGSQLVAAVIQRCAEYGGSGWAYVRTALEDCKARGVTLEQYQQEQIKRASGGATRVDRPEPSGTDILHRDRPLRLKRAE